VCFAAPFFSSTHLFLLFFSFIVDTYTGPAPFLPPHECDLNSVLRDQRFLCSLPSDGSASVEPFLRAVEQAPYIACTFPCGSYLSRLRSLVFSPQDFMFAFSSRPHASASFLLLVAYTPLSSPSRLSTAGPCFARFFSRRPPPLRIFTKAARAAGVENRPEFFILAHTDLSSFSFPFKVLPPPIFMDSPNGPGSHP